MAKQSKATRKFEKTKLKGTLERRKDFAKVKQRHKQNDKRKQKAGKDAREEDGNDEAAIPHQSKVSGEDMDQDDFFQEPVPLPKANGTHGGGKKRKRSGNDNQNDGEVSSSDLSSAESDAHEDEEDHQGQLKALAEKDPEFYKFLQQNDADLLDFDDDEEAAGSDDQDDRPTKKQKRSADGGAIDVTTDMVKKWKTAMTEQHSISALKQTISAFKTAATAEQDDAKASRYSIPSSAVYHDVLVTALDGVPKILAFHLPVKETAAGKVRVQTDSPKFKTLSPLIKTHVSSIQVLLTQLSDTATLRHTLQSFEPLLPYLLEYRKLLKTIVRSIGGIWGDNSADEATRISAFLILRRLMVVGDPGIKESVLKSTYEGVVKGSRNVTELTLPAVNLMKNSAAELWGIDQKVSYTAAFTFIRQLAIHLRGHVTKPTKDSYKMIYNWQFVHSLDFWSRVLSNHCNSLLEAQNGKESQLRPLIYPVVQITVGVMRLIPTSTYFPLRFQMMRSLLRISQSTGRYIPLSAALLEVLNSPEMKKPAKAATLRPLDFTSNIRASTSYLKTRVYQDGVGEQVVELFAEFFVLWAKSIAFPELQLPVTVMLKRWLKIASKPSGNKNAKLNQAILLLVQKAEANAKWVEERRNKVNFAPKDRAEVEAFLKDVAWEDTPLGAYVLTQRKQKEDRQRVIEQGRAADRRKKGRSEDDDFEGL